MSVVILRAVAVYPLETKHSAQGENHWKTGLVGQMHVKGIFNFKKT